LFELLLRDELVTLPAGTRIRFTARAVQDADPDRPEVEIRVTDTGPGLPEEWLRLIFDPFVCRSESPAEFGINLMACYFIVHHHGGTIHARSEPGHGTTFVIRLPIRPTTEVSPASDTDFLRKAVLNEELWHRLAGGLLPPETGARPPA